MNDSLDEFDPVAQSCVTVLPIILGAQLSLSVAAICDLQRRDHIDTGLKWMFYGFIAITFINTAIW